MATNFYYIYSLKDPRTNPARPFYIGKGSGSRAYDHLIRPDATRKYKKIKEIQSGGFDVIIDILADDLSEIQSLKLEAELISAFGTVDSGGMLTNSVIPNGNGNGKGTGIHTIMPYGAVETSQLGLELIKKSVVQIVKANPDGLTNAQVAAALGLRSDHEGKQKDYLSYSVLGLLLREGKVATKKEGGKRLYI